MKYKDWKAFHQLKTEEDVSHYLFNNIMRGDVPVALYICPICDEVIETETLECPNKCKGE